MYLRFASLLITVIAAVMASGCCCMAPNGGRLHNYPAGCEMDCGECSDCSGGYGTGTYVPQGPYEAIHMWRKNLFNGNGCGAIYRGEWMSTPPANCDPCCDPCCAPGAGYGYSQRHCTWHPGMLFGHLYGKRFCGECGLSHGGYQCTEQDGCYDPGPGFHEEIISEGEYIDQASSARMATGMTPNRATLPPIMGRTKNTSVPSRSRITRAAGSRRVTGQQD